MNTSSPNLAAGYIAARNHEKRRPDFEARLFRELERKASEKTLIESIRTTRGRDDLENTVERLRPNQRQSFLRTLKPIFPYTLPNGIVVKVK